METIRKRRRHCSFCGETEHNKRTCAKRKSAILCFYQERAETRKKILEKMRNLGCGVGTIIKVENFHYFIDKISWDNITISPYYPVFRVRRMGIEESEDDDNIYHFDLPRDWFYEDEKNFMSWTLDIINPVSSDTIGNNLPDDWHNGTVGILPGYLI